MLLFIPLLFLFGVLWLLNKFLIDGYFDVRFLGRLTIIFFVALSAIVHMWQAVSISNGLVEATEYQRNIIYFAGIFEALAVGVLIFIKTLRWASIGIIISLLALIVLNYFDILTEFRFFDFEGERDFTESIFEYLTIIIWVVVFGIFLRSRLGIIGAKRETQ